MQSENSFSRKVYSEAAYDGIVKLVSQYPKALAGSGSADRQVQRMWGLMSPMAHL
jgi:hypothetical protein